MPISSYDYAVIRVVPRVERGELLNVGVILFCRTLRFLGAQVAVDERRLQALWPAIDMLEVERHLALIPRICEGGPGTGQLGAITLAERFHWLVAPRSTCIQTSPVHCGLSVDPAETLERLMAQLVHVPA